MAHIEEDDSPKKKVGLPELSELFARGRPRESFEFPSDSLGLPVIQQRQADLFLSMMKENGSLINEIIPSTLGKLSPALQEFIFSQAKLHADTVLSELAAQLKDKDYNLEELLLSAVQINESVKAGVVTELAAVLSLLASQLLNYAPEEPLAAQAALYQTFGVRSTQASQNFLADMQEVVFNDVLGVSHFGLEDFTNSRLLSSGDDIETISGQIATTIDSSNPWLARFIDYRRLTANRALANFRTDYGIDIAKKSYQATLDLLALLTRGKKTQVLDNLFASPPTPTNPDQSD